jgi:hypothetical protein
MTKIEKRLREWLEKQSADAYSRARVKSALRDEHCGQWWRGNGAMAKKVLEWLDEEKDDNNE